MRLTLVADSPQLFAHLALNAFQLSTNAGHRLVNVAPQHYLDTDDTRWIGNMGRRRFDGWQSPQFNWKNGLAGSRAQGTLSGSSAGFELSLAETSNFGSNPGALRMFSHRPDNLPLDAPLVVILHGCGQSAVEYIGGAGWVTLAERLRFTVVAPEQNRSNNPNGCFNWFQPEDTKCDHGEALSIRQMIAYAVTHWGGDQERIFITGLSAGGAMTSVMLARYPHVFAGGAIIAGLPFGAADSLPEAFASMRQPTPRSPRAWGDSVRGASRHRGKWPVVSVWHGDADTTVSPANAEATIAQWADLHGVTEAPTLQDQRNGYYRRVWRDVQGRPALESYRIAGMPHGTPIASGIGQDQCGRAGPFIVETGISSSYRIAEFWGLTERETVHPQNDLRAYADSAATIPDAEFAFDVRPRGGFDIQNVISKALRAAGLMKEP